MNTKTTVTLENIERILEQMKKNTKTDSISIKTKLSNRRLPLTCSKFGGFPYWPKSKSIPYPCSSDGRNLPLTMLAQINLSDLPENDIFPNKGILQFFVLNQLDIDNYRILFHKSIEEPIVFTQAGPIIPTSLMPDEIEITKESGQKITVPNIFWGEEGFPVTGELELDFSKKCEFVNPTENCFETEFRKAAKQQNISVPDDFDIFSDLSDDVYNEFYKFGCGHKLLGRPCFVQYDYRDNEENENDILLFQMDSAWSESGDTNRENFINFGDAGTAGFFIKKDDLKNLDFSKVFYDWACC